jgi:ribonucleoside-triphosphate reductase
VGSIARKKQEGLKRVKTASAKTNRLEEIFKKSESPVVTFKLPCVACEKPTLFAVALVFDDAGNPCDLKTSRGVLRWDRTADQRLTAAPHGGGGWQVKCRRCTELDGGDSEEAAENTVVYSRVVGYYSPLSHWNKGKRREFARRRYFRLGTETKGGGGRD